MTPEGNHRPEKIKFIYTKAPGYRVVYGSGVYGGVAPQSTIKFDIYTEYKNPPEREIRTIEEDGKLGEPEEQVTEGTLTVERERQIGVIISIDQAKSIADWLSGKVKEFEKLQQEERG